MKFIYLKQITMRNLITCSHLIRWSCSLDNGLPDVWRSLDASSWYSLHSPCCNAQEIPPWMSKAASDNTRGLPSTIYWCRFCGHYITAVLEHRCHAVLIPFLKQQHYAIYQILNMIGKRFHACMAERVQVRLYQIWFKKKKRKEILNLEKAVYSMAYILTKKKEEEEKESWLQTHMQAWDLWRTIFLYYLLRNHVIQNSASQDSKREIF